MRSILVKSPVVFNEEQHTYTYKDTSLSGVTGILNKYIFPDKYAGVNKKVLNAAAEHGTLIHKQMEDYINRNWGAGGKKEFMGTCEIEVFNAASLLKQKGIRPLCAEYLVSDKNLIASKIDIVSEDYDLIDTKTTYELDKEYVRWQLSIYAVLFELQNPKLKAGKLYALWLKGDRCELVEVERIDDSVIKNLLTIAFIGAEKFDNPLNTIGDDEDALMTELASIQGQKKQMEEREKEIQSIIRERMIERKSHAIKKDGWRITLGEDTKTLKLDEKRLKEERPAIWSKFLKESPVKGRLTITFA